MTETNPAERRRPLNFEDVKARFPVGADVFVKNPLASDEVKVKVTGVRFGGTAGTKGHSIFVDTEEDRGEGRKPKKRSCRPAYCRAA